MLLRSRPPAPVPFPPDSCPRSRTTMTASSQTQSQPPIAASSSSQSWTSWILDSYASSITPYDHSAPTEEPIAEEEDHTPWTKSSTTFQRQNISISPTDLPSNPSSQPSPLKKTGRGGAGNIHWETSPPPDQPQQTRKTSPTRTVLDQHHQHHRRQSSLTERQKAAALTEPLSRSSTFPLPTSQSAAPLSVSPSSKPPTITKRPGKKPAYITTHLPAPTDNHSPTLRSPTYLPSLSPSQTQFRARSPQRSFTMPASPSTSSGTNPGKGIGFGRGGAGNYAATSETAEDARARRKKEEERSIAAQTRLRAEEEVDGILKAPQGALVREGREREA